MGLEEVPESDLTASDVTQTPAPACATEDTPIHTSGAAAMAVKSGYLASKNTGQSPLAELFPMFCSITTSTVCEQVFASSHAARLAVAFTSLLRFFLHRIGWL